MSATTRSAADRQTVLLGITYTTPRHAQVPQTTLGDTPARRALRAPQHLRASLALRTKPGRRVDGERCAGYSQQSEREIRLEPCGGVNARRRSRANKVQTSPTPLTTTRSRAPRRIWVLGPVSRTPRHPTTLPVGSCKQEVPSSILGSGPRFSRVLGFARGHFVGTCSHGRASLDDHLDCIDSPIRVQIFDHMCVGRVRHSRVVSEPHRYLDVVAFV